MELEEMKTLWQEMSVKVEKQQIITDQLIMEMTQQKYRNKFSKLMMYEVSGAVICYIMAVFMLLNIQKLDTWYLLICGIFSVTFLAILPFFSLRSLNKIKRLEIANYSYKEALVRFAKSKKRVLLLQRMGLYLSPLFFLVVLPVMHKMFNGKDMFQSDVSAFPWVFVGIFFVFIILFSRWGYGCYKSMTNSAENVLKELDE
ncbi:MAG: hypothetical protein AAF489_04940 [Bacteroidota bacterium]